MATIRIAFLGDEHGGVIETSEKRDQGCISVVISCDGGVLHEPGGSGANEHRVCLWQATPLLSGRLGCGATLAPMGADWSRARASSNGRHLGGVASAAREQNRHSQTCRIRALDVCLGNSAFPMSRFAPLPARSRNDRPCVPSPVWWRLAVATPTRFGYWPKRFMSSPSSTMRSLRDVKSANASGRIRPLGHLWRRL